MEGKIFNNGNFQKESADLTWNEHPKFRGVFMKDILTGESTDNSISIHVVKIDPGCSIENHIHEGKSEIHEIINGNAEAAIGEKKVDYSPGTVSFIPKDIEHEVNAGESGLTMLAKFTPALK